jgi:hypothetical protein
MANTAPFPCPSAWPFGAQTLVLATESGVLGRFHPVTFVNFPTRTRIPFDSPAARLHGVAQAKGEQA